MLYSTFVCWLLYDYQSLYRLDFHGLGVKSSPYIECLCFFFRRIMKLLVSVRAPNQCIMVLNLSLCSLLELGRICLSVVSYISSVVSICWASSLFIERRFLCQFVVSWLRCWASSLIYRASFLFVERPLCLSSVASYVLCRARIP